MAFKIYTKTGDQGETSLFGGRRLLKSDLRIEAYGTVDELNSFLGLVRDSVSGENLKSDLKNIQDLLFAMGSTLATDPAKDLKTPEVDEDDVKVLEMAMDEMDASLEPLKNFILPGGHPTVSFCHIARTVCRRAERICVALGQTEEVPEILVIYLNRLSDYLFVLSRKLSKDLGVKEVLWAPRKPKS